MGIGQSNVRYGEHGCWALGGACCYTISGEQFNESPQGLWDFCDVYNCCKAHVNDIVGFDACDNWYDSPESTYTICENACIGEGSCWSIADSMNFESGTPGGAEVLIGPGACNGDGACYDLCDETVGSCSIGDSSCVGDYACEMVAYDNESDEVFIHDNSCVGYEACLELGDYSEVIIDVDTGSCIGYGACSGTGYVNTEGITIEGGSCIGDYACQDAGHYTDNGQIIIGSGSCVGESACQYLGEYSYDGILIGNGSCLNDDACFSAGRYNIELAMRQRTCIEGDDSECYNCYDSDGTDPITFSRSGFECPYNQTKNITAYLSTGYDDGYDDGYGDDDNGGYDDAYVYDDNIQ